MCDDDAPDGFAFPEPGSERTVAACVNCGGTIVKAGDVWRHEDTGMGGC